MNHRSHLGARERRARSRLAKLLHDMPILCGSLVEMERVCGKERCKCTRGEKHPALCLSIRVGDRRKMIHVPKAFEPAVRSCVANYREVKELLGRVSGACLERWLEEKEREKREMGKGSPAKRRSKGRPEKK